MSERYINNLTGDFSICFSEHLTEHPSYYVCNRKPGDGLIAPLRSIVFFRIEKRDEPLRYASRTLASLNAMKGGSGKKKSKKLAR